MKNKLLNVLVVFLFVGCNQSTEIKSTSTDVSKPSATVDDALVWSGVYEGLLPCADCDGIKTKITLNRDNSFHKEVFYLGKDSTLFEEKGIIKWDTDNNTVSLNDSSKYLVGKDNICQLGQDGSKILGALSENYVLKKVIF